MQGKASEHAYMHHRQHFLLLLLLTLLLLSCNTDNKSQKRKVVVINHNATLLPKGVKMQEGDVVFRLGGGIMSSAVLEADPKGGYSHCGIVVDSAGTLMVVHAVPGEPEYEGDPDRVKMETPEKFFAKENAFKGEIKRPIDASVGHKAARAALRTYHRNTLFDHDYNNEDTTRMYCTELVIHAFKMAGHPIVGAPQHHFNIPALEITCWMPSDIYDSKFFKPVARFPKYKKVKHS